jgi:hypothetical protein
MNTFKITYLLIFVQNQKDFITIHLNDIKLYLVQVSNSWTTVFILGL